MAGLERDYPYGTDVYRQLPYRVEYGQRCSGGRTSVGSLVRASTGSGIGVCMYWYTVQAEESGNVQRDNGR